MQDFCTHYWTLNRTHIHKKKESVKLNQGVSAFQDIYQQTYNVIKTIFQTLSSAQDAIILHIFT